MGWRRYSLWTNIKRLGVCSSPSSGWVLPRRLPFQMGGVERRIVRLKPLVEVAEVLTVDYTGGSAQKMCSI